MPYQPLTEDQYNKAKAAGFSQDQIVQNELKRKSDEVAKPVLPPAPPSIGDNYRAGKLNAGDVVVQGLGQAAGEANDMLMSKWSPIGWATHALGAAAKGVSAIIKPPTDLVAKGIGLGLRKIVGEDTADKIGAKVEKVATGPTATGLNEMIHSPRVEGDLKAFGNIATTAGLLSGTKDTLEGMGQLADVARAKLQEPLQARFTTQANKEWAQAAEGKAKPTRILDRSTAQGKDPIDTLASRGISPKDYLHEGKLETAPVADQFRTQEPKVAETVLDQGLKEVDKQRPPMPLDEVKKIAIDNVDKSGLTAGQKVAMREKIDAEFSAIQGEQGDKINFENSNAAKRTYWRNTFGDRIDLKNVESSTNYQVGRAFKQAIENGVGDVTDALNIKDLNNYIGNFYDTANFLDSLNGKRLPMTLGQKVTGMALKTAGTAVGEAVAPGIGGAVGGYYAARTIGQLLQEMPNPLRSYFLRNLQVADPGVLTEAQAWLREQAGAQGSRLALPAPKPLGSAENPIIPPAPTTYERGVPQTVKPPAPQQLALPAGTGNGGSTIALPEKFKNNIDYFGPVRKP